jgi:hypothetical protein
VECWSRVTSGDQREARGLTAFWANRRGADPVGSAPSSFAVLSESSSRDLRGFPGSMFAAPEHRSDDRAEKHAYAPCAEPHRREEWNDCE